MERQQQKPPEKTAIPKIKTKSWERQEKEAVLMVYFCLSTIAIGGLGILVWAVIDTIIGSGKLMMAALPALFFAVLGIKRLIQFSIERSKEKKREKQEKAG